jgi:hypothetical protein
MKKTALIAAFLACGALFGSVPEPVLVYRGRLVDVENASRPVVDTGKEKSMKFSVYPLLSGGTAVFTRTLSVPVNKDGSFEAALSGPALTAAIADGTAKYVGVSIGNAPEIQPRRALLTEPFVVRAGRADTLGGTIYVSELEAGEVKADSVSAATLSVGGCLRTLNTNDTVRLSAVNVRRDATLKLGRPGTLRVFASGAEPEVLNAGKTWERGEIVVPGDATRNGVALFCDAETSGTPMMLAVPVFVTEGEPLRAPAAARRTTRVLFYPFASAE